jgi:cold shock CspA family protein
MSKKILLSGYVKFWDAKKGYGFVVIDEGNAEVFVHATKCIDGFVPRLRQRGGIYR